AAGNELCRRSDTGWIRVVAVVVDGYSVDTAKRPQATRNRRCGFESLLDQDTVDAKHRSCRRRRTSMRDVVFSRERQSDLQFFRGTGYFGAGQGEGRAGSVRRDVQRAKVRTLRKTKTQGTATGRSLPVREKAVIRIQDRPLRANRPREYFPFRSGDFLDAAEPFQVRGRGIRDHDDLRRCQRRQVSNLTHVI